MKKVFDKCTAKHVLKLFKKLLSFSRKILFLKCLVFIAMNVEIPVVIDSHLIYKHHIIASRYGTSTYKIENNVLYVVIKKACLQETLFIVCAFMTVNNENK